MNDIGHTAGGGGTVASDSKWGGRGTGPEPGETIADDAEQTRVQIDDVVVGDPPDAATTVVAGDRAEPRPASQLPDPPESDAMASRILQRVDRRIRGSRGFVYIAVAVTAVLVGVLIAWRSISGAVPVTLSVTRAELTVIPSSAVGHCPTTVFIFTATVQTNDAAGQVAFRWRKPDGLLSSVRNVDAPATAGGITEILQFAYEGSRGAQGYAQLLVLAPERLSTPPVEVIYRCP
jgi:hypothetical protein